MDKYIYLSIGTNKGDRISNSKLVIKKISNISNIIRISNFYKTQSWGFSADYFLNFIIQIQTKLLPIDLLDELIKIEKQMGRYRKPHLNENKYVVGLRDTPSFEIKYIHEPHPSNKIDFLENYCKQVN